MAHNARLVFAAVWILLQVTLVLTADRRVDGAFGFRMFSESSTITVALFREVDGASGGTDRVHVEQGSWVARSSDGGRHRFTWYARVPAPHWTFDQETHASYGAATQLDRLQHALDDVATHIEADAETRRLVLDVVVRRNGREPVVHQLFSRARRAATPTGSTP